jgi:hypothetical protein
MPTPSSTRETPPKEAAQRRLAGGLAEWAWRAALRLAMLKLPGVYMIQLIVWPDGRRQLVVHNPEQPHKLEDLGG